MHLSGKGYIMKTLFTVAAVSFFLVNNAHALLITAINPSAYSSDPVQMDLNLGIDASFIIENFEDLTLVPGLTWSNVNGIFTQPVLGQAPFTPLDITGEWDGEYSLVAGHNYDNGDPVFTFNKPLTSFGIGITEHNPSKTVQIYVDDIFVQNTTSPVYDDNGNIIQNSPLIDGLVLDPINRAKNGYLWIVAGEGETFNKVSFIGSDGDQIFYDHLALGVAQGSTSPVPEPGTISLLMAGITGAALFIRKKGAKAL